MRNGVVSTEIVVVTRTISHITSSLSPSFQAREGGKDAAGAAMREDAIMMDLFARGLKQLKGEGESTPLVKVRGDAFDDNIFILLIM